MRVHLSRTAAMSLHRCCPETTLPEEARPITAMRQFQDNEVMMVLFGLGFNFGKLPDYSPGSENDAPEEPEGGPKKPDPNAPAQPAPAQPATTPAPAQ